MAYLILAVRVALGALLLVAGVLKAHDGPTLTAISIAGYRILPGPVVAPLAVGLPYLEILVGAYLVSGMFTRATAWFATAQFLVFAGAVASLLVRHIHTDCGCFGSGVATPPSWIHVAFDCLLAAAAALVALRAPGAYALETRLGLSLQPPPPNAPPTFAMESGGSPPRGDRGALPPV
jgi:uncharacterized membrane protein YphA (DoxX/SURF4 family)